MGYQNTALENTIRNTPPTSGLEPYAGVWGTDQIVHVLKRCLYGATINDIGFFKNLTMSQAVDILLQPTAIPAPPLNNYSIGGFTDPSGVALWSTWVNSNIAINNTMLTEGRIRSLRTWWFGQQFTASRSIHEKMTVFWHNHFAIDMDTAKEKIKPVHWYNHYLILRQHALGNFKTMVKAITLDPAMLYFLNGAENESASPNENYARELQELYTVGKGIDSQYTEDDVRTAAKVLTGHTVSRTNFQYFFDASKHDFSNKEFSSFYGDAVITGYAGANGANELDALLNVIFQQQETARHICRKIYKHFIYYKIDTHVEQNVIRPLAIIFKNSNFNISTLLSTLFKSQHFYDLMYTSACIIKSPLDFIVGAINEFEVPLPPINNNEATYAVWEILQERASELQQTIGKINEVAGWYPYYLEPTFHELWINSVTYTRRAFFTDQIIGMGFMQNMQNVLIDPLAFTNKLTTPADPNELLKEVFQIVLRYPISESAKEFIKRSILLSGQANDYYWTDAWNAYKADPNNMQFKDIVLTRLKALYKYIMNLPEYHLS